MHATEYPSPPAARPRANLGSPGARCRSGDDPARLRPNHINLWLFRRRRRRAVIIDTGYDLDATREAGTPSSRPSVKLAGDAHHRHHCHRTDSGSPVAVRTKSGAPGA